MFVSCMISRFINIISQYIDIYIYFFFNDFHVECIRLRLSQVNTRRFHNLITLAFACSFLNRWLKSMSLTAM